MGLVKNQDAHYYNILNDVKLVAPLIESAFNTNTFLYGELLPNISEPMKFIDAV